MTTKLPRHYSDKIDELCANMQRARASLVQDIEAAETELRDLKSELDRMDRMLQAPRGVAL